MRRIQVQLALLLTTVALLVGAFALVTSSASAQRPNSQPSGPATQINPPAEVGTNPNQAPLGQQDPALGGPTTTPTASATATHTVTAGASPTCVPNLNPTWTAGTSAPAPGRYNGAGAVAGDGNFYLMGGYDSANNPIANNDQYSATANTWASRAPLPVARANAAIGSLGNTVYLAGGDVSSAATATPVPILQSYDVTANTWITNAAMLTEISGAQGWGFAATNRFYVFGGDSSVGNEVSTQIYSPITNTWTTGAAMPGPKSYGAAASDGTSIYVVGGYDGVAPVGALFRYNPVTDSWTTLVADPSPRFRPGASYRAGKIYVTGGSAGFYTTPLNTIDVYDIATGTWTTASPLLATRVAHGQGTLPDGRIIVATGLSPTNVRSTTVELLALAVSCTTPSATPTVGNTATATHTATAGIGTTATATHTATAGIGTTATVTATPTMCPIQFVDVPADNSFYTYVRCLACRGIVSGYPCGGPGEPCPGQYYRPNNNVTRGQTSKIVSESAGFTNVIPATQQTFEDVPPASTFYLWIERLAGRGIIGGYPCGGPFEPCVAPGNKPYFRPGNNVTRGQLSKITAGAAGWSETPTTQTFEDVPVGSTFYVYIERMAARGIISGYPCGGPFEPCVSPGNRPYFRPNNNATRAQMAKIAASAFFPNCQTPAAVAPARIGKPNVRTVTP